MCNTLNSTHFLAIFFIVWTKLNVNQQEATNGENPVKCEVYGYVERSLVESLSFILFHFMC